MYSLYNDKKVKNVNIRLSQRDYDRLTQVFQSRDDNLKNVHRNMTEFIRWILKTFCEVQRHKLYNYNYFENNNRNF